MGKIKLFFAFVFLLLFEFFLVLSIAFFWGVLFSWVVPHDVFSWLRLFALVLLSRWVLRWVAMRIYFAVSSRFGGDK